MERTQQAQAKKMRKEVVLPIYEKVDRYVRKKLESGKRKISCTKGCAGCCYQLTRINQAEAFALASYLKAKLSPTELSLLKEHLIASQQVTMQSETLRDYMMSQTPCPLLKVSTGREWGGTCTVYEVRPLACRLYFVITPPELCNPVPGNAYVDVGSADFQELWVGADMEMARRVQFNTAPIDAPLSFNLEWALRFVEGAPGPPADEVQRVVTHYRKMLTQGALENLKLEEKHGGCEDPTCSGQHDHHPEAPAGGVRGRGEDSSREAVEEAPGGGPVGAEDPESNPAQVGDALP